jgi:mono/diheme cytochrome c family protein
MSRASLVLTVALAAGALSSVTGCRGQTSKESPIVGIRGMYDQPRYDMQSKVAFFPDHRSMRLPVENTVPREEVLDQEIATGRLPDDSGYVLTIPQDVLRPRDLRGGPTARGGLEPLMERGEERFNIYCTPCHDKTGSGHGMAVKHGMLAPPSFHQDRIRHMPDGQIFATISNGIRNMPAYGISVPINDRWAIVAYVRALQLSQAQLATSKESEL